MGKRKQKPIKVFYMSAEENTLRQMPKYNPYACGHGAHGHKGYNRRQEKRKFRKDLEAS